MATNKTMLVACMTSYCANVGCTIVSLPSSEALTEALTEVFYSLPKKQFLTEKHGSLPKSNIPYRNPYRNKKIPYRK